MTDATPTQPTGSGKMIWRKPLTEDVIEFGTLPDPRDARIAEMAAALREVRLLYSDPRYLSRSNIEVMLDDMMRTIDKALMLPPESDMTITQEELPA